MTTPDDSTDTPEDSTEGTPVPVSESAAREDPHPLPLLLAAIPFMLVATYRYGFTGMLLRLAPALVFGGAWRLLPIHVRFQTWAVWTLLLIGGFGGGMTMHIVLELR